ncbi:type II toxin-antitoxin system HicA family toxin [Nitrospina watsonii]|uniref:Type II toxin-antitoxin system HicA family toxin n=1 Tax=Nitrospina watsonii TaxID=1323948 RepID=A0ABM9HFI2_9BACT|nr:type II toxin-antitoxin system HicA family toxin [Nitrospina watsonii]CAI2719041.1 conserved protein of unknown function [Nitrospina watsonii]
MTRLTPQHWKTLLKAYQKLGFEKDRERGDHIILTKPGVPRPLVLPKYESVDIDIIQANMRSGGFTREEYLKALHK